MKIVLDIYRREQLLFTKYSYYKIMEWKGPMLDKILHPNPRSVGLQILEIPSQTLQRRQLVSQLLQIRHRGLEAIPIP